MWDPYCDGGQLASYYFTKLEFYNKVTKFLQRKFSNLIIKRLNFIAQRITNYQKMNHQYLHSSE